MACVSITCTKLICKCVFEKLSLNTKFCVCHLVGKTMKKEESILLGQILKKADINLTAYGIKVEELAEGERELTYEEMQYVLGKNPATHLLSVNLKEELSSSK